jgi:hypothetical protein
MNVYQRRAGNGERPVEEQPPGKAKGRGRIRPQIGPPTFYRTNGLKTI